VKPEIWEGERKQVPMSSNKISTRIIIYNISINTGIGKYLDIHGRNGCPIPFIIIQIRVHKYVELLLYLFTIISPRLGQAET